MTAVGPAPEGTPCPLWLAFLNRVTNRDAELIRYLQVVAGYMLTGSTKEHALFFAYGTGCSEKHVRNLLNKGELRRWKLGGKLWRVRPKAVEEQRQADHRTFAPVVLFVWFGSIGA